MNTSRLHTCWQQLPENQIRSLQAARLRQYLREVILPFSPHYGKLFCESGVDIDSIHTLEDMRRLPFTTKADLLPTPENPQKFREFILAPQREVLTHRFSVIARAALHGKKNVEHELSEEFRPVSLFFTTGRATEPLPFALTKHDIANLELASHRLMEICEARAEFRMINAFPFAPHLAFWFTYYAGMTYGVLNVSTGGGKVAGTEGNLRLIEKLNPDVLIGMPTFIYHLLLQAREKRLRCDNLKWIVLGGEKVSEGMRRKLRELAFGIGARHLNILATYGFTEAKMAWSECPSPQGEPLSGYHVYPDLAIVEIVDPKTGIPVPNGHPGEIVFTPLDARGSVVLRYRTGDYIDGGLTYEVCPCCGRSVPRLVGNISRASEIREMNLEKLKGTLVDFNQLEHILDDAPHVGAWQLELRKAHDDPDELDELILHVQKSDSTSDSQLIRELNDRFHCQTEIRPNGIFFHNADEMRLLQGVGVQLKEQKIVDHRPGGNGPAIGRKRAEVYEH